ncbi:hypothetical protein [Galenea microaerophila]
MVVPKKKIENWAANADKTPNKASNEASSQTEKEQIVKKMGISFSEEEYLLLKEAATKSKRSMQNFIRYAVEKTAKEELNN